MSGDEDLARTSIVLGAMFERPSYGSSSVVDTLVDRCLGEETVVDRNYYESAVLEFCIDVFVACFEATTMEPYHNGSILHVGRIIHIEFAALLSIGIRVCAVGDVVDASILCHNC